MSDLAIVADIKIDKNDLVTVAVSRAERTLNASLVEANAALKASEKRKSELTKSLEKTDQAAAESLVGKAAAAFKAAAETVNGKVNTTISSTTSGDKFTATLQISQPNGGYGNFGFSVSAALSGDQLGLIAELKTVQDDITQHRDNVLAIRSRLAKLPSLERQYRAQLVEAELNKTEAGKDLLAAFNGDIAKDILALPACG